MGIVSCLEKSSFPSASNWQSDQSWHRHTITCKWEPLRKLVLVQWARLSAAEVDEAGPNRTRLAQLVHSKYSVPAPMVENYLRNFERMLPLT